MPVPLNQFENYIDKTILNRGLQYYEDGHVHDPDEISLGEYEFIVEGSLYYTVQITLEDGMITDYDCDCPYDLGPVCKHVVAALYYLREEMEDQYIEIEENPKQTTLSDQPAKRKTITEQVNELLEIISHDELKLFIVEQAATNRSFRNLFLSSFAQFNPDETKELYSEQVRATLNMATNRHGFIEWSAVGMVTHSISTLLNTAEKQVENRNYNTAFLICTAIMEEVSDLLEVSDDSDGEMYGLVETAYDILWTIAQDPLSEEIRKQMFNYCCTSFEKGIYSDWNWHIGILSLAESLLQTEEEMEAIFKVIDKTQKSEYTTEKAQKIKYNIVLKFKGESAADQYVEQNITNPDLRRKAIQKAMLKANYDRAVAIAQDGVNYDSKKLGLVWEWYNWLLKIAQAQHDTEKIIEYARLLFIDNFRKEQDYFQILKDHVKPEEWKEFIEAVIQDIRNKSRWPDTDLIADIFIKEEWWDRLLELVKKNPTFRTIEIYEKYLAKDFSAEVVALYTKGITEYMRDNMGRNHYQEACRYIRRIINLGARDKAYELILHLKSEYPKRKALMEELSKI